MVVSSLDDYKIKWMAKVLPFHIDIQWDALIIELNSLMIIIFASLYHRWITIILEVFFYK